jgi:hypothetical protein
MTEFPNGVDYPVLLRAGEMLVDRKADHFPGMPIRHGKLPRRIAEMFQAFLLIKRNRIVDLGLDAIVQAVLVKLVAPLGEHHVEMVDVPHVWPPRRDAQTGQAGKSGVVIGGILDPPLRDLAGLADEPVADHGLHGIEPRIAAENCYFVAVFHAVIADQPQPLVHRVVIGHDDAGVAPDV